MSGLEFKSKFIGFIDILGFKEMVKAAEAETGVPLATLAAIARDLGAPEDSHRFSKYGPMICPESAYVQRNLDFQLTQVSDCVVVSSEVSPAGAVNLIHHCWSAVIRLLSRGVMCRGYITRGLLCHVDGHLYGSGYQEALSKEPEVSAFKREANERGTPFVEVDRIVCDYVRDHCDRCVKEVFSRFVKGDGNVTALFPFQRLVHSFIIAGLGQKFDPERELASNRNLYLTITDYRNRVMALVEQATSDALRKAQHYVAALDAQLEECRKTEKMIHSLRAGTPP